MRDVLPVNRAMPFWLDIADGEEIAPCTLAWAQRRGWLWKIPTQGRYGCGYVYSDAHTTPDQAKAEIEAVLGHAIEPRNDIKIDAGRLDRRWIGNCVALGLSSSFLEPLEATSIHGTIVQLMLLSVDAADPDGRGRAAITPPSPGRSTISATSSGCTMSANAATAPFWQDVAASHPAGGDGPAGPLGRTTMPGPQDFHAFPDGPAAMCRTDLHVPVLDGLGLLNPAVGTGRTGRPPRAARPGPQDPCDTLSQEYRQAANRCLAATAPFCNSLQQESAS